MPALTLVEEEQIAKAGGKLLETSVAGQIVRRTNLWWT